MFRKLEEKRWGLIIKIKKTENMVVGDTSDSLGVDIGPYKLKNCGNSKYLGVTFSNSGKSNDVIINKIGRRMTSDPATQLISVE